MSSYKIPPDSDNESEEIHGEEKPKPERKLPEFIYLNDDSFEKSQKIGETHQDPQQMFGSIETISKRRQPFYLRMLAFIGTFILMVFSLFLFACAIIVGILSLLLFRQSSYLNEQAFVTWKSFKKASVFTLGCFVCIFNLSFGVGIVLMYFMLSGEKFDNRFVQEFTKHR